MTAIYLQGIEISMLLRIVNEEKIRIDLSRISDCEKIQPLLFLENMNDKLKEAFKKEKEKFKKKGKNE